MKKIFLFAFSLFSVMVIHAQMVMTTPTSNPNSCDGNAVVNSSNFISWYWTDTSNNQIQNGGDTLDNLCTGNYVLFYDNGNGVISENFTILGGDPCASIGSSYTITNASNANSCDGYLSMIGIGNTYFVDYLWNNGATTSYIDNLCPGFYEVSATDSSGCYTYTSFYVLVDSVFNTVLSGAVYTDDESSVGNCDGSAQVSVFGGVAPFQYIHSSGATGPSAYNLCAGQYSVLVVDANNDSLYFNYLISSDSVNLVYNPYLDSINVNTLYTDLVQLCSIDITTIDSAFVDYFYSNHPDSLTINWSIHTSAGWQDMTADYYIGNSPNGVYTVVLSIFCPVKSGPEQIKIISEIYVDRAILQVNHYPTIDVNAYPNPFNQSVSIELPDNNPYDLILYNGLGQMVRTIHTSGESTTVTMHDLSELSRGSYLLMIQGEQAIYKVKLVK